jgi:hypothetical protein
MRRYGVLLSLLLGLRPRAHHLSRSGHITRYPLPEPEIPRPKPEIPEPALPVAISDSRANYLHLYWVIRVAWPGTRTTRNRGVVVKELKSNNNKSPRLRPSLIYSSSRNSPSSPQLCGRGRSCGGRLASPRLLPPLKPSHAIGHRLALSVSRQLTTWSRGAIDATAASPRQSSE